MEIVPLVSNIRISDYDKAIKKVIIRDLMTFFDKYEHIKKLIDYGEKSIVDHKILFNNLNEKKVGAEYDILFYYLIYEYRYFNEYNIITKRNIFKSKRLANNYVNLNIPSQIIQHFSIETEGIDKNIFIYMYFLVFIINYSENVSDEQSVIIKELFKLVLDKKLFTIKEFTKCKNYIGEMTFSNFKIVYSLNSDVEMKSDFLYKHNIREFYRIFEYYGFGVITFEDYIKIIDNEPSIFYGLTVFFHLFIEELYCYAISLVEFDPGVDIYNYVVKNYGND